MIRPSASTASTPSTWRAHRAPAHDLEAAGVGGHQATDGRGVASPEVDAECPARRAGRGVERGQRDAGCRRHLARGVVDRTDGVEPAQRQHDRHRPAGTPPPTRPVLPPWGTTATSSLVAPSQDRGHLVDRAGPHDGRGPPDEAPGPVLLVACSQVGVDQHVTSADDGGEISQVSQDGQAQVWATRARSSIARASSASSSVIVSGGMRRSTFSAGPQVEHDHPLVEACPLHRRGLGGIGAARSPIISPRPRTSSTPAQTGGAGPQPVEEQGAERRPARRHSPSPSITSRVASPAAQATGLPPKVVPWVPGGQRSKSARSAIRPPSGKPEAMPFANSRTSGATPRRGGGEHLPGAADAALHLVEHQEDAVLVAPLAEALEPGDRRGHVAALAEHRLHDHGGDGVVRRLQREQLVERAERGLGRLLGPAVAQRVRVRRDRHAAEQGLVAGAVLALGRRERRGAERAAVEAAAEGDDAGPSRHVASQLDRAVDRLGAGVAEEHLRRRRTTGSAR